MASYIFSQFVYPGDLILAYGPDKVDMLVVKSAPGSIDTNPKASSITVQKVNWHIPAQKGFWAKSGPEVWYVEEGEADHEVCKCGDHSDDHPENPLNHFLDLLGSTDTSENKKRGDIGLIVNPHGRYVLPFPAQVTNYHPGPLLAQPR